MSYNYKQPSDLANPLVPMTALASAASHMAAAAGHSRQERDLLASASYGHKDEVIYCPEGIPIKQALYALSAAATAALGFLYRAITMATGGRRRRRRRQAQEDAGGSDSLMDAASFRVSDVFHAGNFWETLFLPWLSHPLLIVLVFVSYAPIQGY